MKNPETYEEIEALKRIETTFSMNKQGKESAYREYTNSIYPYYDDFDLVLSALKRLKAIENSKPSKALKCLELLGDFEWHNKLLKEQSTDLFNTIEGYILKAQELEKENPKTHDVNLNKALKDLDEINVCLETREDENIWYRQHDTIKQVLNELKEIKETKPSEALECVNKLWQDINVENNFRNDFKHLKTINNYILKAQEQENVLKELIFLINDLEPTFNRKGVSSDTDKLGTIAKDYFYDNASELLKRYFEDDKGI